MKSSFSLLIVVCFFTSCIPTQKVPKGSIMTDFFHFQKAEKYDSSKWTVFPPGTGGLRIFKDTIHYYNVASRLNKEGISVLLVDNVAAYKASKRNVSEASEEEILWVLNQALSWAKVHQKIDPTSYGSIVGWSRAGMGIIPLAHDSLRIDSMHINKLALFYPANPQKLKLKTHLPTLVLTGELDKVVKSDAVEKYLTGKNSKINVYENAYHGFDGESMKKGKYFRFIPFLGKKQYILKYNEAAAEDAFKELIQFLKSN